jgi:hypothetical protein
MFSFNGDGKSVTDYRPYGWNAAQLRFTGEANYIIIRLSYGLFN